MKATAEPAEVSRPRAFLVGAGPGDPGLITVKGQHLLARADVIFYDHLISPQLLQSAASKAKCVYVGKRAGRHLYTQTQINQMLIDHAGEHETVVRLKGGDPCIFGRGGEEALALREAGICFEIVPGITAGLGVPVYAGICLTHRDFASNVAFITGHEEGSRIDDTQIDWPALAAWRGTLVFYMGVTKIDVICAKLLEHHMPAHTPAAIITWGATPKQRTLTGRLDNLAERTREEGIRPPALILFGKVVTLRERLNWFETRPLFGQSIIVTRTAVQGADLVGELTDLGAHVFSCPTIRIEPANDPRPLDDAIAHLTDYRWTIFTSANAVEHFFHRLHRKHLDARQLAGAKVCAVGPVTAEKLRNFGIIADLIPAEYHAGAIATALTERVDLSDQTVLMPQADIAPSDLPKALRAQGARVDEVTAYHTLPDDSQQEHLRHILATGAIDWITFTSSSTVTNFLKLVDAQTLLNQPIKIASIGPQTSQTLVLAGLTPTVQADPHTTDGLVQAICPNA